MVECCRSSIASTGEQLLRWIITALAAIAKKRQPRSFRVRESLATPLALSRSPEGDDRMLARGFRDRNGFSAGSPRGTSSISEGHGRQPGAL